MGRPKGSGEGLEVMVGVRLTPELAALVDAFAAPLGLTRGQAIREIVCRWGARRPKGAKK